jgi:methylenetetrahydrofolate reductase (NADPH)
VAGIPRRRRSATEAPEHRLTRLAVIEASGLEVIPLRSLDAAIEALPPRSRVSVTASPAKGLAATQEITEQLIAGGHQAVPHISARLVRDRTHTRALAAWLRSAAIDEIFLVGGDVTEPGRYDSALGFLTDLLETDHGLARVGVTAYPDGHPLIDPATLHEALSAKQATLAEAGLEGYCSTQMCFDAARIVRWLQGERRAGIDLPVHLGVAGVVDRAKLLSIGVRLGIGQSLRYLRKNRRAVTRLMVAPHYDPNDLLVSLSAHLVDLDIRALHIFTFNQVAATVAWRDQALRRA